MFAEDVILKPVLTEKGYDGIADKRYTFYVKNTANKIEIRSAVEKLFGVKVAKVNTNEGYTPDRKKAVVILKEDSKPIEFFNSLA